MENKRLFGKICYLQRQMTRENKYKFAEYGLTPIQLDVLIFIHKSMLAGENVSQRDIEKRINIRPSSVSCLIGNLESKGFLTRATNLGDARIKLLTLTEEGEKIAIKNRELMQKCDKIIESALTDKEQDELKDLLEKIIGFIEKCEKEEQNA